MKKFLLVGAIVLFAAVVINYSLGGFDAIEPSLISTSETVLYGYPYEGSHSSDNLNKKVESLRNIISISGIEGTLTIVNYTQSEYEKRGLVKQFVGIEWVGTQENTNTLLDTLIIPAYNGLQFRIPIKPLVMPSPVKLLKLAQEAATDMDGELADFTIEQYSDKFLITNFPLK